jgi:hypothetical protein
VTDPRPWTHAALFGALWGAAEITLGATLNAARVPLAGMAMASFGVFCQVTARRLQPVVGTTFVLGLVAALLKVFSLGGFVLGPLVGILAQSLLMELAMTATRSRAAGAITGGALALASAPLQRLFSVVVIAGGETTRALERALTMTAASLGWRRASSLVFVLVVIGAVAALGAGVGAAAWRMAGRVRRRLRGDV